MKRMAVLWAVFLLGMGAWAERVVDRLHGFALDLPEGWKVVLGEGGLLLTDLESALLVRGMPLKPPKEAVRPLLEEARRLSGGQATLHFKPASGGLMLLARGLGYPLPLTQGAMGDLLLFAADPQVQAALSGLRYEATHLLLPGPKSLLAVSAYLPQDLPTDRRKEVLGLLRSLGFLGPEERVPYREEAVLDPLLGVPALRVPVPQGYTLQGGVVDFTETQRRPVFQLSKGGVVLRREAIYLQALAIATPFGGSPSTILLWNGRAGKVPGFLCAQGPGELPALFAQGLWAWETGSPWEVEKAKPLQGVSRVARYLEGVREAFYWQMDQQMLMAMGRPGDQFQSWRQSLDLRARQGSVGRQAVVEALGFFRYAPPSPLLPWTAPSIWSSVWCRAPRRPSPGRKGFWPGSSSASPWTPLGGFGGGKEPDGEPRPHPDGPPDEQGSGGVQLLDEPLLDQPPLRPDLRPRPSHRGDLPPLQAVL
jgi:hypothetical protein